MIPSATSYERRTLGLLRQRWMEEPVIAIHGPRSVGKSTLLRRFAAEHGVEVVDLDDVAIRTAALRNLATFVDRTPPLCVDEYQRVPDVLDEIKALLNRNGSRPGTAVLTGSTRHDALPREAQALTGRVHVMTLLPLSQGEIDGQHENLIEALFADSTHAINSHPSSSTDRTSYVSRICRGGFPIGISRSASARNRWFDDYVTTSIERDVLELSRIRHRDALRRTLLHLASRTAQVLNVVSVGNAIESSRNATELHIRLLEDLFLIRRLDAWGTSLRSRVQKHPKVHIVDSGLAARIARINEEKLAALNPSALVGFGHLLETFVVGELCKQVSWIDESLEVGHWRTADGDEVDFVIEAEDGRVIAFEVKAGERVLPSDLRGLRKLREALGDRFVAGIALTTGRHSFTEEDRLHICPVDRLWTTVE